MTIGRKNSSEVDYSGCVKNIMVVLSVRPVSLPRRMLCAPRRTRTFSALSLLTLTVIRSVWWSFSDYMIFWLTHIVTVITMRILEMLTMWAVGPKKCQVWTNHKKRNNNIRYWDQSVKSVKIQLQKKIWYKCLEKRALLSNHIFLLQLNLTSIYMQLILHLVPVKNVIFKSSIDI